MQIDGSARVYGILRLITFREARFGDLQIHIADSGAVAMMPSGRLTARIGPGSARLLSCQLVGLLSMGGCRRRGGSAWALEDWHGHRGQLRRLAPPRRLRR